MDLPIVLSIISIVISVISLAVIFVMLKRLSSIGTANNDGADKKISDLKADIFNEFSRNRTEEAARAKAQRDELSGKLAEIRQETAALNNAQREALAKGLSDMQSKLEQLTSSNNESISRLNIQIIRQLGEISEKSSQMSQAQNQKMEESLEKIRVSNEGKLDEMRAVVDEKLTNTLTQRLDSSFKTVSEQLTNLYTALGEMKEMSGGITEHVSSLNRVLTNVKTRGTWAEVQLANILDQTIPGMYVENYAPSTRSKDRVEFAIKIPSGENYSEITYLPLDSKFPMEDYLRLCEAADKADKEATDKVRRELFDRVLSEARDISKYINVPKTTPFAIMYLATEGLYSEIVKSSGLVERIQRDYNVMIAGPTTITALLNSLSLGFKIAAINEKANEVRGILSAVKTQYDKFGGMLEKARKKINEAGETIDEAQHRSNIIQKKLKAIESLGADEADNILQIQAVDNSIELGEDE